jgi:hypothetical protein
MKKIKIKVSDIIKFPFEKEIIEGGVLQARYALDRGVDIEGHYPFNKLAASIREKGFIPEMEVEGSWHEGDFVGPKSIHSKTGRVGFTVWKIDGGYGINHGCHRYATLVAMGVEEIEVFLKNVKS